MDLPVTRYADTDRGAIAIQVVGEGPLTILVNKPPNFPVDLMWEEPSLARFVTGLASFSRCIWFDPLGTGSSDALDEIENRLQCVAFDPVQRDVPRPYTGHVCDGNCPLTPVECVIQPLIGT